jgi:hypothetical protein
MPDVLWSDVSEWQVPVDDSYPFEVLAIRSNDGTYRDKDFAANYAWAKRALASGQLRALIIYMVYRPNWQDTLATTKAMVGTPGPQVAFMIDVESWGGQIKGDQSADVNALFRGLATWVGNPARVIGYGNVGDLNALWPTKPPGIRFIVAGYGSNPDYPGKLGHQFSNGVIDAIPVAPFGAADLNSADGFDIDHFCAAIGIEGDTLPTPADLWSFMLDDPYIAPDGSAATPKSAADLLRWAATHAAYAKEQAITAVGEVAAVQAELTALKTEFAEFEAGLDARIKAAVAGAVLNVHVDVTGGSPIPKSAIAAAVDELHLHHRHGI